jgi:NSS family neurotransmitter:Na+ symporter
MSEDKEIKKWDSNLSFLMAMIGAAIGLGNIWRFPYISYTNGGGAFLIPYLTAILLLGLPFMFLEYGMGYKFKSSLSDLLYRIKPKFEILGWFIALISFLVLCYYVCIVGWDVIYLILSLFKGWGSNPEFFLTNTLLQSTDSVSGITTLVWPVVLTLVAVWIAIWFISHKDLNKGIAKYSKIMIPLLVIIMACIVFFSLTLPGAITGLQTYLNPDWSLLTNTNIWLAAFGQVLFSLSLGWGIITSYSSYLPKGTNLVKNGTIVVIANCSFELFTSIGIFSILGFMSFTQSIPLDQIVTQGTGLIFVVFPVILNTMGEIAYIIGPLFFLCVLFAGITTTVSFLEPLSHGISTKFNVSRNKTATLLCIIGFSVSMLFATRFGNFLLTIFDSFLNQFAILIGIIAICLIFGWYYKLDSLVETINFKSVFIQKTWKIIIKYILPIVLIAIWINGIYNLILESNFLPLIIQVIIATFLVIIPLILTFMKNFIYDNK